VNGELADLLTGDEGGERVLQDLEAAGAFTVSLDAERSWFRYHQMFAALLRLELRRGEPGAVAGLHAAAAGWLAAQGFAVEAVRHAQAARDWELAARLLAGHWPALHLDGQAATVHELLAGFPAGLPAADAGLAVVAAADELAQGSLEGAERYLTLAERHSGSVPADRAEYVRLLAGVVRLLLDRQRGNLPAVVTDVRELQAMTEIADASRPGLGTDLRALALISLGGTEFWADAYEYGDAARHLEQGVALARQIGRPYLEFTGLAQLSAVAISESFTRAVEIGTDVAELAERHGWTGDPAFGLVGADLGSVLTFQGRAEEAERWLQTAERTLTAEVGQPGMAAAIRMTRGQVEMLRNRDSAAVAAFQAADLMAGRLASPHTLIPCIRA
jgi:LuxR family maltose regulon positive regulatory protein